MFISHAICSTSATTLDPRLIMNSAKSVLPSCFCYLAKKSRSVRVLIFLATTISATS